MIPPRYKHMSRETWRGNWPLPATAVGHCFLTLMGSVGTGKTHCAIAYWREAQSRTGLGGWFYETSLGIQQIKREIDGGEERTLKRWQENRVLLLDDIVGKAQRLTDYVKDILQTTLIYRYNENLPTILTTNAQTMRDFDEIDGTGRIRSRLSEGVVIQLNGPDRREAK
jgi:DNA replication protein DnaC